MKIKISLIIILIVISFLVSFCFVLKDYKSTNYSATKVELNPNDNEQIEKQESENILNQNQESITDAIVESEAEVDTNKKEPKKETNNSSNKNNSDKEKNESQEPPVDSTTDGVVIEEKIEKHICNDIDTEYKKWLSNYLKLNSSTRIFNSLEESKKYGEQMLSLDYGYFYGRSPITYEDEFCTKEMYTLQLYIPSDTCGGNEMVYLPNNVEVIHAISYLRNLGYSCPEKIIKN